MCEPDVKSFSSDVLYQGTEQRQDDFKQTSFNGVTSNQQEYLKYIRGRNIITHDKNPELILSLTFL